jgi:hypothetical protein
MTAARAKITDESQLNLGIGWIRKFVEEELGGHNHPVHAISTLGRLLFDEGPLETVRISDASQSLQGCDISVLRSADGKGQD